MNHKVSDFVIRIKNAVLARRKKFSVPSSNLIKIIAETLVKTGFLDSVKENNIDDKKVLEITLKYYKRIPSLTDVKIISKPSLRIYVTAKSLPEVYRRGKYTIILSTSNGVMTGKEAYKKKIGGELLFKIW